MTDTKRCNVCGHMKPLDQFTRDKSRADGRRYCCRACQHAAYKDYDRAHPEKARERRKRWASNKWEVCVLRVLKHRAKKRGVPFDLSVETLPSVPDVCPALGIPLVRNIGGRTAAPNSPSLDRIVPERGYVTGNVAWISHRANAIKQDATPEEIESVARWTREQLHST